MAIAPVLHEMLHVGRGTSAAGDYVPVMLL